MLELQNVCAGYGASQVLHGLSLTVQEGEIVTLIGANGAGKSTTLMTICGLVRARGGCIRFLGRDITAMAPQAIVALGLVQSPEGRRIFARMSVRENLQMGGYLRRDAAGVRDDMDAVLQLFPVLQERVDQTAGTLSGGEQQMLAMGRAMVARPRLLLLDEPSLGLAPLIIKQIFGVIAELQARGTTVLLVEQNATMALQLAHRGYVLETGRIIMSEAAAVLLQDARVRGAYLGE